MTPSWTPVAGWAMGRAKWLAVDHGSDLADPALEGLLVVRRRHLREEGVEPDRLALRHPLGDELGRADPERVVVLHLGHRRPVADHLRLPDGHRGLHRVADDRLAPGGELDLG